MTDYTSWHGGMKLVAIRDGDPLWPIPVREFLVAGRVYVIAAIAPSSDPEVACWVVLERGPHWAGVPAKYDCRGFRPLQHRETDISIFTAMLNKQREDA